MPLIFRLVKGTPLTFLEGDNNLRYLEGLAISSSTNFNSWTGSALSQFAGTASLALTASYALNAGTTINTSSLVTTSSFNAFTSSYNTGSFSGSFTGSLQGTSSFAISASWAPSSTLSTSFISTGSVTASVNTTGNIFTVASSSANLLTVSSSGMVTVATSGSANTMRLYIAGGIYPVIETLGNNEILLKTNNQDRLKVADNVTTNVPLRFGTPPGGVTVPLIRPGTGIRFIDMQLVAGLSGSVRGDILIQSGSLVAQGGGFSVTTGSTSYINVFPSNGNVFIGSTPIDGGFKLDVNGTIRSQNTNYTLPSIWYGGLMQAGIETYIGSSTTASRAIWGNASGNALTLAGNSRFGGTAGAMVVIGALYDFSTTSEYPNSVPLLRIGYDSGDWFGDTTQALSNTTFETIQIRQKYNVTGSTNRLIGIDYDPVFVNQPQTHYAAIFRSGFVGIGTSTPSSLLDVSGSGRFTNGLTISGSLNTSGSSHTLIGSTTIGVTSDNASLTISRASAGIVNINGGNELTLGASGFQALKAFFNGTVDIKGSTLRVTTADNVLIGTTTDGGFKLDVNGTARIQNTLTLSNNRYLQFNYTGESNGFAIKQDTSNRLVIDNNNYAYNVLSIKDAPAVSSSFGLIGIFNQNPTATLDVSGSGRFTDGLTVTGSATITNVLTLPYQDPLPSSPATGSIALSGSGATFVGMFVWTGVWTQI